MSKKRLQVVVTEMNRTWHSMYGKRGRFRLGRMRHDDDMLCEKTWLVVFGHRNTPTEWGTVAVRIADTNGVHLVPFATKNRMTSYMCAGCLGRTVCEVSIGDREITCDCWKEAG